MRWRSSQRTPCKSGIPHKVRKVIMLKSTGKIIYDPRRPGLQSRNQWWCVANIDDGIAEYFRHWLKFEKHIYLQPPAWGAHISVIRGEKPREDLMHLWKKYHGKTVTFEYDHVGDYSIARSKYHTAGENSGDFYFVHVRCPELIDIRRELKLKTDWDLHLTIGRTHEYSARKIGRKSK
jgi:hypothetical protein